MEAATRGDGLVVVAVVLTRAAASKLVLVLVLVLSLMSQSRARDDSRIRGTIGVVGVVFCRRNLVAVGNGKSAPASPRGSEPETLCDRAGDYRA